MKRKKKVVFLYKDTPLRRRALEGDIKAGYSLYGFNELKSEGLPVECFLGGCLGKGKRVIAAVLRKILCWWVGSSGNPTLVLAALPQLKRSAGVVATSNNVAIPLLLFKWLGVLRVPVFFISVGLGDDHSDSSIGRRRRLGWLLSKAETILVFSEEEKNFLQGRFQVPTDRVKWIPYGFSVEYFPKFQDCGKRSGSFLTVGADFQRDVELLKNWSLSNPDERIQCVLSQELVDRLIEVPESWDVQVDIPLEEVYLLLQKTFGVIIPVKSNRYTAGTTFLIQALAAGIPTLVSRTGALQSMREAEPFPFLTYVPGDLDSMAAGIEKLQTMEDARKREMRRECRAWAEKWGDGRFLREELRKFIEGSRS